MGRQDYRRRPWEGSPQRVIASYSKESLTLAVSGERRDTKNLIGKSEDHVETLKTHKGAIVKCYDEVKVKSKPRGE